MNVTCTPQHFAFQRGIFATIKNQIRLREKAWRIAKAEYEAVKAAFKQLAYSLTSPRVWPEAISCVLVHTKSLLYTFIWGILCGNAYKHTENTDNASSDVRAQNNFGRGLEQTPRERMCQNLKSSFYYDDGLKNTKQIIEEVGYLPPGAFTLSCNRKNIYCCVFFCSEYINDKKKGSIESIEEIVISNEGKISCPSLISDQEFNSVEDFIAGLTEHCKSSEKQKKPMCYPIAAWRRLQKACIAVNIFDDKIVDALKWYINNLVSKFNLKSAIYQIICQEEDSTWHVMAYKEGKYQSFSLFWEPSKGVYIQKGIYFETFEKALEQKLGVGFWSLRQLWMNHFGSLNLKVFPGPAPEVNENRKEQFQQMQGILKETYLRIFGLLDQEIAAPSLDGEEPTREQMALAQAFLGLQKPMTFELAAFCKSEMLSAIYIQNKRDMDHDNTKQVLNAIKSAWSVYERYVRVNQLRGPEEIWDLDS